MKKRKELIFLSAVFLMIVFLAVILSFSITGYASKGGKGHAGHGKTPPQCNDGIDNDGDGYCDFIWRKVKCTDGSIPGDSDCSDKNDNDETGSFNPCADGSCTCSEQQGYICSEEEYCPGSNLISIDTDRCCNQECEIPTCTTCATCGGGLFNLCDRAECYSCTSGSCYFIDNVLIDECISCTGATCSSYETDQVTCYDDPCGFGNCQWVGDSCLVGGTTSNILRDFSSSSVSPGEVIDVTLYVSVLGGETYYALEEYVPAGWTVVDDSGGNTSNPNRLAWVFFDQINVLPDIQITYSVQAPYESGTYSFDGIYMFEGGIESTILGETEVIVN
ncbi:MAG: hypothetical protein PVJ67_05765 [Candidatus Pacearchaeota archaeon]|jgi:hypothetical protein